ncbi:MAG: KOW motif-containing protein [Bdellovibrionales bacterium]|nr:KOW motif-containing protein [Bdellovibrionales bacterium]
MKKKIKLGDEVQVISGGDKGKKGVVLELLQSKIRVKDVKIQTHFDKEKGIQKKEGFIDYSNVKLIKSVKKVYKKSKKTSSKKS